MFRRSARIPNNTLGTWRGLVPAHSPYLPGHSQAMLTANSITDSLLELIRAGISGAVIAAVLGKIAGAQEGPQTE